jgi:predicted nucleic acid-binding protein
MLNRLLDSVVLIDHLNNISKATNYILSLEPEDTAISVITRAEILVGVKKESRSKVLSLLDRYTTFSIDINIADIASELRREYSWKLPDAFQAALAKHYNLMLCTRNTKDFDPRKHAFVDIPYKL